MTVKQMMGQDWMVACMIPKGLRDHDQMLDEDDDDVTVRQDDGQHAEDDGAGAVHSSQLPGGQKGESGGKQGFGGGVLWLHGKGNNQYEEGRW